MNRKKKDNSKRKNTKWKDKTLEERIAFLERAYKKRVKFKDVLAMYKLIKDIYAKLEKIDEELKKCYQK